MSDSEDRRQLCESCYGDNVYISVNTVHNCVDNSCSHPNLTLLTPISEAIKDRLTLYSPEAIIVPHRII